jgi:phosphatidate cytidylyltransferase
MLMTRVISALVLAAVLFACLFAQNPLFFQVFLAVFGAAAAWEWYRLTGLSSVQSLALALLTVLAGVALHLYGGRTGLLVVLAAACIVWVVVVLPTLKGGILPTRLPDSQTALLGAVVLVAALIAANQSWLQHGAWYLISLLLVVVVADIFAYATGKTIGRHKLAPAISPGKSWEGAIGGAVAVILYGLLCMLSPSEWANASFPAALAKVWGLPLAAMMMAGLAAASVAGDLFESMLKRRVGVKDSSKLLPGHGGVLDRIDAQLPVLPVAMLLTWSAP